MSDSEDFPIWEPNIDEEAEAGAIPESLSKVVAGWLPAIESEIPAALLGADTWTELRTVALRSDRGGIDSEGERIKLVMEWMWGTVLPTMQAHADERGLGHAWRQMCDQRTSEAAEQAMFEARSMGAARAAAIASNVQHAANCAERAIEPWIDQSQSWRHFDNDYVGVGEGTARSACLSARDDEHWSAFDPAALLMKLCAVG